MLKIAFGLVGMLLLAACAYTPQSTPTSMSAGVGHPDNTYPGPRVY
ncbi:MAG TPA: hypothetical protein VFQ90_12795 [Stellaceae bacterium]|jgi:uncharacterized lipoprotein YajG|nr:hypothetical protein [Stellaceae bacterium]